MQESLSVINYLKLPLKRVDLQNMIFCRSGIHMGLMARSFSTGVPTACRLVGGLSLSTHKSLMWQLTAWQKARESVTPKDARTETEQDKSHSWLWTAPWIPPYFPQNHLRWVNYVLQPHWRERACSRMDAPGETQWAILQVTYHLDHRKALQMPILQGLHSWPEYSVSS